MQYHILVVAAPTTKSSASQAEVALCGFDHSGERDRAFHSLQTTIDRNIPSNTLVSLARFNEPAEPSSDLSIYPVLFYRPDQIGVARFELALSPSDLPKDSPYSLLDSNSNDAILSRVRGWLCPSAYDDSTVN